MKFLLRLSIFVLFSTISFSQTKTFSTEDVVINSYSSLAPKNLNQLNWIPGTKKYAFVEKNDTGDVLLSVNADDDSREILITLEELNNAIDDGKLKKSTYFPRILWKDDKSFLFWNSNHLLCFNINTKELKNQNQIHIDAENKTIAPDKKTVAYTLRNNLFVSFDTKNLLQITDDENQGIINGQAVHRNEFGIKGGIFFSPKSNYLAYYRKDETMVTQYPLVDISTTPASLRNIRYPMAGQTSEQVTIGVVNLKTMKKIWLKTGLPKDKYLTCVTWSPDEKYIYLAELNRDQNHLKLQKFDIATGELVKTLFEETSEKYVEPEHRLYFLPQRNDRFIWFSERDGWNHLYLYDTNGQLIKQLTKGQWVVTDFNGFDYSGQNAIITTTKDSPLERHIYKLNIFSGEMTPLTPESGVHSIKINDKYDYFLDTYTSITTPRKIKLLKSKSNRFKNIFTAQNPITDYKLGDIKIFRIKDVSGDELFCRMVLPVDFDSTKKYPVVFYVYGGPHVQLIKNSWPVGRYSFWFQKMAENGYIVFTLDNHGSDNRGLKFEQATFRHLGTREIKDQLLGVKYLKTLSYVDTNRFGVFGWSYGGFMTTSLMLRSNNTFKVGVAGGAVIDWRYYEVMYTERYMDTPQSNPAGYDESSLLNYIQNLKGKLLMIHGTMDPTVVWQNTLKFAQQAIHMNKPLDYFPYVGHGHGVTGKDAIHLYEKVTNYFLDNL